MTRPVPAAALDLLREFEGRHDGDKSTPNIWEPERDPVGIYTVGYGYALFEDGKPVRDRARAIDLWQRRWPSGFGAAEAEQLLRDVAQDVGDRVLRLLPGVTLTDGQYGALVCLAYNIGVGEVGGADDFADSTVRRKLLAGDVQGAAAAFALWNKGRPDPKGPLVVIPGLVRRRAAESALFLSDLPAVAPVPVLMAHEAPPMVPLAIPLLQAAAAAVAPTVATWLGSAIGGKAGDAVAAAATAAVTAVTGTDDPSRAAQLLADPEKAAELTRRLAEIQLDQLRLEAADRADARKQTVDLARLGSPLAWGTAVVSGWILLLFGVVLIGEMAGHLVGDGSKKLLEYMLIGVGAYWLGSSRGSAEKTDLLKRG
jgi:lysozyme